MYIQAMGHSNYANAILGSNLNVKGTGWGNDTRCKIFDMASEMTEWTTEFSLKTSDGENSPCAMHGGGAYVTDGKTSTRWYGTVELEFWSLGFRGAMYIK